MKIFLSFLCEGGEVLVDGVGRRQLWAAILHGNNSFRASYWTNAYKWTLPIGQKHMTTSIGHWAYQEATKDVIINKKLVDGLDWKG